MPKPALFALGCYFFFLLPLVFLYLFLTIWAAAEEHQAGPPLTAGGPAVDLIIRKGTLLGQAFALREPAWLALLVMVAGGLGSYLHSATSFADYVGNRRLRRSWIWWLLLRVPIGMVLALLFYFLLRGGLLIGNNSAANEYGFVAIAALVGMFSKQATDKLRELFDTLFKTNADKERAAPLANPVPVVTGIWPEMLQRGETLPPKLDVLGRDFTGQSIIRLRGTERPTSFEAQNKLSCKLAEADLQDAGPLEIAVFTPEPGGGISNSVLLPVEGMASPAPVATELRPPRLRRTDVPSPRIEVIGRDFTRQSVARVRGSERRTTFETSERLSFQLTEADLQDPAPLEIAVLTPPPGGGTSSPLTLPVEA